MNKIFLITDKPGEIKDLFHKNYPYYKVIEFNELLKEIFNLTKLFGKTEELNKFKILIEKTEEERKNDLYIEEIINRKKFDLDNFFRFISKDIKFKVENLIKDYDIILFNVTEIDELKELEEKFKEVFDIKTVKLIFDKEIALNEKIQFLLTDYNINLKDKELDKGKLLKSIKNAIPEIISYQEKTNTLSLVKKEYTDKELEYIKNYEEIRNVLVNEKIYNDIISNKIDELNNDIYLNKFNWFEELTVLTVVLNKILENKKINTNKKVIDILINEFSLEDYKVLFYYSFRMYILDFALNKLINLNKNELDKLYIEIANLNYNFNEEYKKVINNNLLNYKTIYKVLNNFFEEKYKQIDTKYSVLDKIYNLL